ncbi:hypothetical protein RVR_8257 [Actinacidiphila reveromycinica]|uniref:Uncharacterized protein n=1 Tax=Actinacidiphila reveromycinica TaxID=659352 RepID=A0A7U3UYF9_9ACTN|nr:hypothetical protein [Streptomyces sp. SN-593]BBB01025.1 hypothetical protein RVR_8257 [Streptomyces sp. SN-593]
MMTDEQATQAVWDLMGHAIEGRGEQAARLLAEIGADSDGPRMYGICCAIAEIGKATLRQLYPHMTWGPSGYMWAMQQLGPGSPADVWAARFLVAYADGDKANANALWSAATAASGDEHVDSICALVTTVAGLAITALRKKRGEA